MSIRSTIIATAGLAAATVAFASPAFAEYKVCNKTSRTTSVAVGYYDDRTNDGVSNGVWTSEGWWNIQPGSCATPIEGPLKVRYVYIWPGDSPFCAKDASFTIRGNENCERRGFYTKNFTEVDTGADAKSYTTNLTDD